ncbi:MAG: hypothetical protein PHV82_07960 [Victivallaceae bacterium]|nr:hypothetical protein [Victivallaceae bacterium]
MNTTNNRQLPPYNIILRPRNVLTVLFCIIAFLLFANLAGIVLRFYFKHKYCCGLVPCFDFDTEGNIPTFYSSIALFCASMLIAFIAASHKKAKGHYWFLWAVLSVIFLVLALDEFTEIHDRFEKPTEKLLTATGIVHSSKILFYTWVLPYILLLLCLGVSYFKFLLKLPRRTMVLFIVSGVIFVAGAIGFESLGGLEHKLYGDDNVVYALLYTCEELLEMIGIAIFIYALLSYIGENLTDFSISVRKTTDK